MAPTQVSTFLDGAIRNRISVRLIAEQHIALYHAFVTSEEADPSCTGVIDMSLSPQKMVNMCGSFVSDLCEASLGVSPKIEISGDVGATFAYVPVHIEYILTEVLKNSFRATVEHHQRHHGSSSLHDLPPVQVTISSPLEFPALPIDNHKFLSIRVRDRGGGVSQTDMARIFSYGFTTAGRKDDNALEEEDDPFTNGPYAAQYVGGSAMMDGGGHGDEGLFGEITGKGVQTGMGTIAGLGYGLPMSRLYAKYFGGSLDLYPLEGWGSDVFIKLRCLDEAGDSAI
ncbi:hypothetical protein ONZ45_g17631 [Pleurotus djamor]|nr:hypothetical protein ONZ45_g17631 [Pleurotus djamor]